MDRPVRPAQELRATLIETIQRQRHGFRTLGSSFYDRLGEELTTAILEDGPAWTTLAPFAGASFQDAYVLRFFAAFHRMALEGTALSLAAHFPSTGGDGDARAAMAAIVALLGESPDAAAEVLAVAPQTNEVGRSVALASGLLFIAGETGKAVDLREIGSSGGLNLRLDSYWYEQDGKGWGTPGSTLRFSGLWEGGSPDFSSGADVVDRRGCDRHPIDASTTQGALTLLSYVWPEPPERFVRIRRAMELAREHPVPIDEVDAATWVPDQLARRVRGVTFVLMHSIVWQYLAPDTAAAITEAMVAAGAKATPHSPLAWLRLEPRPDTYIPAELRVTLWSGSGPHEHLLGTTGFHGGPITWLSGSRPC